MISDVTLPRTESTVPDGKLLHCHSMTFSVYWFADLHRGAGLLHNVPGVR